MEQFKTKKPSRFNTWCAMATFRLCDAEIEEQHHCNLIQGKGCSRKQFGRYVAQYPLSDEAVGMLIDAADNRSKIQMMFSFPQPNPHIIKYLLKIKAFLLHSYPMRYFEISCLSCFRFPAKKITSAESNH